MITYFRHILLLILLLSINKEVESQIIPGQGVLEEGFKNETIHPKTIINGFFGIDFKWRAFKYPSYSEYENQKPLKRKYFVLKAKKQESNFALSLNKADSIGLNEMFLGSLILGDKLLIKFNTGKIELTFGVTNIKSLEGLKPIEKPFSEELGDYLLNRLKGDFSLFEIKNNLETYNLIFKKVKGSFCLWSINTKR